MSQERTFVVSLWVFVFFVFQVRVRMSLSCDEGMKKPLREGGVLWC